MRSKNPPSWARTGAVSGNKAIRAAATINAGKRATIAEYADACARLKTSWSMARTTARCVMRGRRSSRFTDNSLSHANSGTTVEFHQDFQRLRNAVTSLDCMLRMFSNSLFCCE